MKVFLCVRVYPNGEAKEAIRDEEGKNSWVEYNTKFRGNAQFINGELTYGKNFLSLFPVKEVTKLLKEDYEKRKDCLVPDTIGIHPEFLGSSFLGTREGYPDDRPTNIILHQLRPKYED